MTVVLVNFDVFTNIKALWWCQHVRRTSQMDKNLPLLSGEFSTAWDYAPDHAAETLEIKRKRTSLTTEQTSSKVYFEIAIHLLR